MSLPAAHIMKHAPWAITKVGLVEQCAWRFTQKYVLKRWDVEQPGPEARMGVAVHKYLEARLQGRPPREALQLAEHNGELTSDEYEALLTRRDGMESFVVRIEAFRKKQGISQRGVLTEKELAVRVDFSATGYKSADAFLRGSIDLALVTPRGELIIIDHKSGVEKPIEEHDLQCRAYAVFAVANMPFIRSVQTAIHYTQSGKLDWNKPYTLDRIRDEFQPWLMKYIERATVGLACEPKPTTGWWCDTRCGFRGECPAYAKVANEQRSK